MKFKINKHLKEKVSNLSSRVKEPAHFEKWRIRLFIFTVLFCLVWLPYKFLYILEAGAKSTFFFCGMSMTGLLLLTSMIKPGSKSFWIIFINILITLPITLFYLPLAEAINLFPILNAFFGLFPLWIPISYMFFLTWNNNQLKKKHKEEIWENAQGSKKIRLNT